ncbi:hypothetical protein ACA910_009964 [Epithemia clementina (nom. ined.)]
MGLSFSRILDLTPVLCLHQSLNRGMAVKNDVSLLAFGIPSWSKRGVLFAKASMALESATFLMHSLTLFSMLDNIAVFDIHSPSSAMCSKTTYTSNAKP